MQQQSQISALLQWGQLEITQGRQRQAIHLYKQALHRSPSRYQLQVHRKAIYSQQVSQQISAQPWL